MSDGNESTFFAHEPMEGVFRSIRGALSTIRREDLGRMVEKICLAVEHICFDAGEQTSAEPAAVQRAPVSRPRGGLAPWQVKKLRHFIGSNLDQNLSIKALASLVGFSQCHLSRSFRISFGESPHAMSFESV